jgi:hypothetical protein
MCRGSSPYTRSLENQTSTCSKMNLTGTKAITTNYGPRRCEIEPTAFNGKVLVILVDSVIAFS